MILLPITLTAAGAAAVINFWLAMRVSQLRRRHGVLIGDGGNEALTARMRAHANFAEYTPLVLILLGLIELAEGSALWLWAVAAIYLAARLAHAAGMDGRPTARKIGIVVSVSMMMGLAIYALVLARFD